ncbi:MAG: BlaI/MecI/CopY family transcriptional regulator [Bacteroidia bacterium]
MKELTKAEEQIMQVLWDIKKGFVKDILEQLDEPKPAYNTVSTIVRILETKGFVSHNSYGKTHEYFPAVVKEDYKRDLTKNVVEKYFGGSVRNMVSFFVDEKKINLKDIDFILQQIAEQQKQKS